MPTAPRPALRTALVALAVATLPAAARAQDLGGCDPDGPTPPMLSAANLVFYGCGYLFKSSPSQPALAQSYFERAALLEPRSAVAHFLLGASLAGQGRADSARAVVTRALKLDPEVGRRLGARFAERPELRERMEALFRPAPATPTAPAAAPVPAAAPAAPPVRPAAAPVAPAAPAAPAPAPAAPATPATPAWGGALVLGSYACTYDYWSGAGAYRRMVSDPKGSLTLRADGTYRRLDNGGTGRYAYEAATGEIRWLTGPMAAMKPERTRFRRNQRTAQIDIRLSGVYEWSCGIDLP
ncbi:hypothetical protein [Roseisolibacter agri]|uniref:Tetratricopeptide repeat protein n=1 Tax=Roseisolibacter agri TaxID=2014610 RepID=A0AA37QIL9_9BACT|nr:hypothetical protein [Roseisolibacter agri]GLC27543.1 hypothetical protein rosag_40560 [Roseisolibacter agri]